MSRYQGGGGGGGGNRKTILAPIHFIFDLLSKKTPVSIWLYEQVQWRIEGTIRGFDEFMNLVIDNAVEVYIGSKIIEEGHRRKLGQILLKGDNISLIQKRPS